LALVATASGQVAKSGPAPTVKPTSKPIAAPTPQVAATSPAQPPQLAVDPLDWPSWRGPQQNGVSQETGLIDSWDYAGEGKNLLWKNPEAGSISTPIVMRGKLYTLARNEPDTTREGEKVICLDAATGKKLWQNAFNIYLSDVPAERVGWSCCVGDPTTGRVYAMSVCGLLQCLDGDTGKTIWSRSLNEQFGLLSTYGGRTNVPVLAEDKLIISSVIIGWGDMARPAHRFMAFDKNTGEMIWFNGTRPLPEDTTYSTPLVSVLKGKKELVFGSGDGGVYGFQPRTGKQIWSFQLSRRGINVSPIVNDYFVYIAHAEENLDNQTMGGIVRIDGSGSGDVTKSNEMWRYPGMVGKSSPLLIDGRLYAFDDGAKMYVVDAATGQEICKPIKLIGTIMRGSPVYADGKIYAATTMAWHVIKPTAEGAKITHKLRLPADEEVGGSPIVSHGRIYLPTTGNLYCLGEKDAKPQATPAPPSPEENPVSADETPALVQVVPCEVLLTTNQKQSFTARLYNASGQFLKTAPATFTLDGPGAIDAQGVYTAPGGSAHVAAYVTAKVGELSGQARLRVVPPLPWKFDFSDGEVPVTWVGARYRNIVREVDGEKLMVKVTTIPKGTRSGSFMGPTNLSNYTIQADVRGSLTNNKLPDMGVVAQRYTLDLMGASQQLQIRSWTPQLEKRFAKNLPIAWKENVWYTLKLQASTDGNKAVLRGKVWPRSEPEPKAWSIEATDEVGNLMGSPGLWGNANDSEVFYDNIQVTPN
jgi:outer membrane protein assembly factor BamB